jgi:hypothetical protein
MLVIITKFLIFAMRDGEAGYLVGLITRRSRVRVPFPQQNKMI